MCSTRVHRLHHTLQGWNSKSISNVVIFTGPRPNLLFFFSKPALTSCDSVGIAFPKINGMEEVERRNVLRTLRRSLRNRFASVFFRTTCVSRPIAWNPKSTSVEVVLLLGTNLAINTGLDPLLSF